MSVNPQISLDDVALAAQNGFTAIICNRPDGEDAGQLSAAAVAQACAAHGLKFVHIPITGSAAPDQIAAMGKALAEAGGPVLAYCRSGTRSTHAWARACAQDGTSPSQLIAAAAGAGYDLTPIAPLLEQA
jgi:uncharacterized protein (TIGR01244 family)